MAQGQQEDTMTNTIVGVFDAVQEAESAAEDLIHHGFDRGDVRVVKPEAAKTGGSMDLLVDAGLPADDAREYADELRSGGALVAVKTEDTETPRALDILKAHGLADVSTTGTQATESSGTVEAGRNIPVVEEQIQVGKMRVRQGGVRIHTRVVEKPVEAEVRLRQEKVTAETIPTDRPATEADLNAFKEGTVEIRESGEEPVIRKEARVVGEVRVGKETEERTETIRDTARKTEVDVERIGEAPASGSVTGSGSGSASASAIDQGRTTYDTAIDQTRGTAAAAGPRTFDSMESDFRQNFQSAGYGDRYRIEQFRPAYRYGYDLAQSRNLMGSDWTTIEPDARRRWEELNPGTWDRFKAAVKYAFDKLRGLA